MHLKQIDIEIIFRLLNAIQKPNTLKGSVANLRPLTLLFQYKKYYQTMYLVELKIRLKDIPLKHKVHIVIVVVLLNCMGLRINDRQNTNRKRKD